MRITEGEITKRFTRQPLMDDQPVRDRRVRECALSMARTIVDLTPECREQSLALTALEEAVMWANAAIARNE